MEINGKPLDEWIKEQTSRDGVLTIHRGTVKTPFGTSMYQGAVVTTDNQEDKCYYHADISIRVNGKEYRMRGDKVERRNGKWYVDGKPFDLPRQENAVKSEGATSCTVVNGDKVTLGKGSRRIDITGMANIGCQMEGAGIINDIVINHDAEIGEVTFHGSRPKTTGHSGRQVKVRSGMVKITRGGKTYTIRGENIEKRDGQWYADGKAVDWDSLGGRYEEKDVVTIEINGSVQNLVTTSGDVTVRGAVANLSTGSGDVTCETAGNVSTGSGDVHCKHIKGMVSTCSGDIFR